MNIKELNLKNELYEYLDKNGINTYYEVQEKAIPLLNKFKSVAVESPTGTGKTLSFLLPMLNQMDLSNDNLEAIVFVPTRELGKQIYNVLLEIKKYFNFTCLLVSGGKEIKQQEDKLKQGVKIIIATPPRFDKIISTNKINFDSLKYLIVDEADMCLDFGFFEYINKFIDILKTNKLTWGLFSATFPLSLQNFIKKQINGKVENIVITRLIEKQVLNFLLNVNEKTGKNKMLLKLMNSNLFNPYIAFIFAKTNDEVLGIYNLLKKEGVKKIGYYTSQLTQREKNKIVKLINNGEMIYLVCTDLMSRGIDIQGVSHIINYSFPSDLSFYRHRIGRTNRNNLVGSIYTIYSDEEKEIIEKIKSQNRFIKFEKITI